MNRLNFNPSFYPLEWFDRVVLETLHPAKIDGAQLSQEQADSFMHRFDREVRSVRLRIKTHVIQLSSPKKVKTAVWQYHTAVQLLIQQATKNCDHYSLRNKPLKTVGKTVVTMMEELVVFLECYYAPFLPPKSVAPSDTQKPPALVQAPGFTVRCNLSADQIGLILKAADELKIIMARSLSIVFKTIIPFLSTKSMAKLSWASVRSHTYVVEESDKEFVVRILEAMIEKIKGY